MYLARCWAGVHVSAALHLKLYDLGGRVEFLQALQLELMDSDRHVHIQACSAVSGDGVLTGFEWLVGDIGDRIYMYD